MSDGSAGPINNVLTCKGRTEDLKWKWIIPFCATFFYNPLLIVYFPYFSPSPRCTLSQVLGRPLISSWEMKKRLEDEFGQHKGPFLQGATALDNVGLLIFFPPHFLSSLLVTKANLPSRKKSEGRNKSFSQIVLASEVHKNKRTPKPVGNFTRGTWNSIRSFWKCLNKGFLSNSCGTWASLSELTTNGKWPIRTWLWEQKHECCGKLWSLANFEVKFWNLVEHFEGEKKLWLVPFFEGCYVNSLSCTSLQSRLAGTFCHLLAHC